MWRLICVCFISVCFYGVKCDPASRELLAELEEIITKKLEERYDKEMAEMRKKLTEQEQKIVELTNEVNDRNRVTRQDWEETEVAFFAYIRDTTGHIGNQQVVIFDHVITNIDSTNSVGGYDHTTGIFTAPLDGLYEFSMTLLSGFDDTNTHYAFHQGNTPLTSIYIDGNTGGQHTWAIGSATAVVSMTKGETMSIRHTNPTNPHALEGAYQNAGQSMFSGYLIRAHFTNGIVG
ncbi:complement C1q tumor necrosis factor-related protein 3-like [Mya arenaria]|uniref:complement C1q tumor necrosis factor-related protein 3-like n=1 Tax=Mya arenaria TaxID=6604 RepID=UPI0022E36403|nr:complement C1q tumor necrosis factor-related protein 3-like [Mya arenaria]